jgi:hypothetical protein
MNQAPVRNLEGMAEPYNGERVDLRIGSEHLTPTAEFQRQRELAQLAKDAGDVAERGPRGYVEEGMAQAEQYANTRDVNEQYRAFFLAVGNNLHVYRDEEISQKIA